jgi:hypothetical protein
VNSILAINKTNTAVSKDELELLSEGLKCNLITNIEIGHKQVPFVQLEVVKGKTVRCHVAFGFYFLTRKKFMILAG